MDRSTAKLVNRLTAMLVNCLTATLVNRLTAKLVVVNLVKLHLTEFICPLTEFIVIMFTRFCFCFLNRTLADLARLPLTVFELISITASLGDFSVCLVLDL